MIIPGNIEKIEKEASIPIMKEDSADKIYYKILRAYFSGCKRIILVGNLTDQQMNFIELVQKRIVGLEVSEQKKNQIILSDLLKSEDVDLDKILHQMFSFVMVMGNDILSHIEEGRQPWDKILDRDSVTARNHNLAYRCCSMALKDSVYLGKLKKTTDQILVISRIVRYLDMIGTILVGMSYLINTEMTEGMRKFYYKAYPKDEKLNKILAQYLKKWLSYMKSIKTTIKDQNIEKAIELYVRRFEFRITFNRKDLKDGEHLASIIDSCEQLNRMSSLILRDFLVY